MDKININKSELMQLITDSVRSVINEERNKLLEILLPTVSKKEMDDIIKRFGEPKDYDSKKFKDMTKWIMG
ncbi:MAG: hypothetical protein EHM58_02920 [Ignavibacteriae bacterium]|nr:MAG: hypothetical protein EHM58_02920 [Ignavibacteriota bacterium]